MAIPFKDAVQRLIRLVEICPELREEFDKPRYYPETRRPAFFEPGELPGTWGKPRELPEETFLQKAEWFLRKMTGSKNSPRLFLALGESGEPLWIRWNTTPDLVYREADDSRETRIVPNSAIYLDEGELDLFCGLANPDRRMLLDWEAGYWLAGKPPEPVWKYAIRQANPSELSPKVELYRMGISEEMYPAELLGKLKLYSWDAVRAWAERKGIPVPDIQKVRLAHAEEKSHGTEPAGGFLSFFLARKLLAERLNSTPDDIAHDIAGWIWHRQLTAYTNVNELGTERRFHFPDALIWERSQDPKDRFDYLPLLEGCYFQKRDIESFQPPERYITGAALIGRWMKYCKSEERAKGRIVSCIGESRLDGFHPIYGGTEPEYAEMENTYLRNAGEHKAKNPPLECALFSLSLVRAVEREDFGEGAEDTRESKTDNPPSQLNRKSTVSGNNGSKAPFLIAESEVIRQISEKKNIPLDEARELYETERQKRLLNTYKPNTQIIGVIGFDASQFGQIVMGERCVVSTDIEDMFAAWGIALDPPARQAERDVNPEPESVPAKNEPMAGTLPGGGPEAMERQAAETASENDGSTVHSGEDIQFDLERADEWREMLVAVITRYRERHEASPTWAQFWGFLSQNPPAEFGVTVHPGKRGVSEACVKMGEISITRDNLRRRFKRLRRAVR